MTCVYHCCVQNEVGTAHFAIGIVVVAFQLINVSNKILFLFSICMCLVSPIAHHCIVPVSSRNRKVSCLHQNNRYPACVNVKPL